VTAAGNSSEMKEAGVPGVLGQSVWSREVEEGLRSLAATAKPRWEH
jgi:hypothetical protein